MVCRCPFKAFSIRIEAIVRCLLPNIPALYESEKGQWEFAGWKQQREAEKQKAKAE